MTELHGIPRRVKVLPEIGDSWEPTVVRSALGLFRYGAEMVYFEDAPAPGRWLILCYDDASLAASSLSVGNWKVVGVIHEDDARALALCVIQNLL
mgnify:FL=1